MVLVLCTSSDHALYLYKNFIKISKRVIELLPGHEIMTDGQMDSQTDRQTDGQVVLVLDLCISSDHALNLYKVS